MLDTGAALLPAVLAGDPRGRERFVELWAPVILGWCARLGGPGLDPEDTAHDVFELALSRLHTLRDPRALAGWMYQLTRRTVVDHRRKAWVRRWLPGASVPEAPSPHPGPDLQLAQARLARLVHAAIDALPTELREVLVLSEVEERNATEVAELVGVPLGTVKSRLRRARERFALEARARGLSPDDLVAAEDAG